MNSTNNSMVTLLNLISIVTMISLIIIFFDFIKDICRERVIEQNELINKIDELTDALCYKSNACESLENLIAELETNNMSLKQENKQLTIAIIKSKNRQSKAKKSFQKASRKEVRNYV